MILFLCSWINPPAKEWNFRNVPKLIWYNLELNLNPTSMWVQFFYEWGIVLIVHFYR